MDFDGPPARDVCLSFFRIRPHDANSDFDKFDVKLSLTQGPWPVTASGNLTHHNYCDENQNY
jgi:hypothetical protein